MEIQFRTVPILQFLEYRNGKGMNESSDYYGSTLRAFDSWLNERGKSLDTFAYQDAEAYMDLIKNARTANQFKAILRSYIKYRVLSLSLGDPSHQFESQRQNQMALLQNRKVKREYKKVSLEPEEIRTLFESLRKSNSTLYSMARLYAYWGCRSIELEKNIFEAEIDWKNSSLIIDTAKNKGLRPRWLAWHDSMTSDIETVLSNGPYLYAGEYFTKGLKHWQKRNLPNGINGMTVTQKTFRKTFQTQERALGVSEVLINAIMGHANSNREGDIYTDYTSPAFLDQVRDVLTTSRHYMIHYGLI